MAFSICSDTVSAADGDVIFVNGSSGNDSNNGYTANTPKLTIKNATNAVNNHGQINIAEGVYAGADNTGITISKSITLTSQNKSGTIINGTNLMQIFIITSGSNVKIKNLTLSNGNGTYGGAIYNEGNLNVDNCDFTSNTANYGGAIYNYYGMAEVSANFINNTANNDGGAIENYRGTLTVTNSNFTVNKASSNGGAIFNDNYLIGALSITNSNFMDNTASGSGGAIFNYFGNAQINSNFQSNHGVYGGAIYNDRSDRLDVTNSYFTMNMAKYGGAIYNYNTNTYPGYPGTLTVTGTEFFSNTANNDGGAIENYWGTLTVTNSNFTANRAALNGGAIYNNNYERGSLLVTTSNFMENNATGKGGAIFNYFGNAQAHFNRIIRNNNLDIYNDRSIITNIENNWWGSNENPSPSKTNIPVTNWVILTINGNPSTINNTETSTITADLNHINGGGNLIGGHIPDGLLTLSIPWGSLANPGQHFITLNTSNGAINPVIFFANQGPVNPSYNPVIVTASADGYSTNELESAKIHINQIMKLTVTKSGPTIANAGTRITYIITVTNNGPDPAENVQIIDIIPPILQGVTHDSFNLGNIPVGESRTIHINGTIPSTTPAETTFQNNATVTSDTTGNITPSLMVTTTVKTLANVDITKIVDNSRPNVGETVTFTVTAHNNGPSGAINIQIQDDMPAGFTGVEINPSQGTYNSGIWTLNLTNGETATITLSGKVTAIMAGKNTTNTATLLGTTNKTNATIYVPQADLYIQITSNKNNPKLGEIFTLTYKLGNKGPDAAENVTITIPLPPGFEISQITGDGKWTYQKNNNTVIWTLNPVEVGDPYLYITGKNTKAGTSLFNASIESATYNINTEGITPLVITTTSPANTTNTNTTVNATRTINMQHTGIPLMVLIMALFMVIGGLVSSKK